MKRLALCFLFCVLMILAIGLCACSNENSTQPSTLYPDNADNSKYVFSLEGDTYTVIACYPRSVHLAIPDTNEGKPVTRISRDTFEVLRPGICEQIITLEIPDSIDIIDEYAFDLLTNLQYNRYDNGWYLGNRNNPYLYFSHMVDNTLPTCKIHPDTKIINAGAFKYGCMLETLEIPEHVSSLSGEQFIYCDHLTSISVSPDNKTYHSSGNCLIETATGVLIRGCKTSVIPKDGSVQQIGPNAFVGCTGLTEIEIPACITEIGSYAFRGCYGLKKITIPGSVKQIGEYAFWNCINLTDVILSHGVTHIGSYAFDGCQGLEHVDFPESITHLGNHVFGYCDNLQLNSYENGYYLGTEENPHILLYSKLSRDISEFRIHEDTKLINSNAFSGCEKLTTIYIPDSVVFIGSYAFSNCTNLEDIRFPPNLAEISNYAFENCVSLTELELPDTLKILGKRVFFGCENLFKIYFQGTKEKWDSIEQGKLSAEEGSATIKVICADLGYIFIIP